MTILFVDMNYNLREVRVMNNDFTNYLSSIINYSKKDIQLQFIFAVVVSLLYLIIIKLLLNKILVTEKHQKQYLGCGFLIAIIFNSFSPYISINISNLYFVNIALNIMILILFLLILSVIEFIITYPLATEKSQLKKYLIWQAITIPIFLLLMNVFSFIIIILISSFAV